MYQIALIEFIYIFFYNINIKEHETGNDIKSNINACTEMSRAGLFDLTYYFLYIPHVVIYNILIV